MKGMEKCTSTLSNTGLDQSAYYQGMAKIKGFDFGAMKKEVQSEMKKNRPTDDDDDDHPSQKGK